MVYSETLMSIVLTHFFHDYYGIRRILRDIQEGAFLEYHFMLLENRIVRDRV